MCDVCYRARIELSIGDIVGVIQLNCKDIILSYSSAQENHEVMFQCISYYTCNAKDDILLNVAEKNKEGGDINIYF